MKQELFPDDAVGTQDIASPCPISEDRSGDVRSGLPLTIPMICGGASNRTILAPDCEVISSRTPHHNLWFVRTGILRLQRFSYDGRRQILSLYLPGEIIGYERQLRDGVSIETVTQSGLCKIDQRRFDLLLRRDRALRDDFLRQQQDQLDRLHWLTWSLGALNTEARLSAFLALSSRFMPFEPLPDGTGILTMMLPRTDIADLLATTVESISRITHRLAETGVIAIKDPSHFRIIDLTRLSALGQISGIFDKAARGPAFRRDRLNDLAALATPPQACFCGR
jgi:CRP/FNR family transcriptional regulator, anaerobic regulatory protein